MHQILSLDDKGVSQAVSTAAKLFRMILLDLNISPMQWDRMLREYLKKPISGVANDRSKLSSQRSNFNRNLSRPRITWRKFREGIDILNPVKVNYELDLEWDPKLTLPNEPPKQISMDRQNQSDELCQMFRYLLIGVGADRYRIWDKLLRRQIDKDFKGKEDNPPDKSTERGNLHKSLINDKNSYTWETFCRGLSVLGVMKATYHINLTWRNGKSTRHSYKFITGTER
tara:strand:- start:1673 stop:2356 length:684 start_codon:yes stop_codon:yes gene_type:complete